MINPVIEANDLSKVYLRRKGKSSSTWSALWRRKSEEIYGLRCASIRVEKGEIVGLIGPNGAGKSTTVKLLCGILRPTSGTLSVLGLSPNDQRKNLTRKIGVVFGQRSQLWWNLRLRESFDLLSHIFKIPKHDYESRVAAFHELIKIGALLEVPIRELSLGQRMQADIVASLLHNPELILLDEPTVGVDVVAKQRIREFLKDINKREGKTIILSTNDMHDLEKLADRVIVIDKGSLVFDGEMSSLRARFGSRRLLRVKVGSDVEDQLLTERGVSIKVRNGYAEIPLPTGCNPAEVIREIQKRWVVQDIDIMSLDIESIIDRFYAHFLQGGANEE